ARWFFGKNRRPFRAEGGIFQASQLTRRVRNDLDSRLWSGKQTRQHEFILEDGNRSLFVHLREPIRPRGELLKVGASRDNDEVFHVQHVKPAVCALREFVCLKEDTVVAIQGQVIVEESVRRSADDVSIGRL